MRKPALPKRSAMGAMGQHGCCEAARVADLMTPEPITVGSERRVDEVLALMAERRIRHIPVVDPDGALCGIVSQRDLLAAPARTAEVGDLMRTAVDTVSPNACAGSAARHMLASKRSSLPVVDAKGDLVGILTEADFLRFVVRASPPCSCGGVRAGAPRGRP